MSIIEQLFVEVTYMQCPFCDSIIKDSAIFCSRCGKKVPRCPTCGVIINKPLKFCVNDGTPIPEDIQCLFPQDLIENEHADVHRVDYLKRKFCINCGKPCTLGSKFCLDCLQATNKTVENVATTFCVECGKTCEDGSLLCSDCQQKHRKKQKGKKALLWILATIILIGAFCFTVYYLYRTDYFPSEATKIIHKWIPIHDEGKMDVVSDEAVEMTIDPFVEKDDDAQIQEPFITMAPAPAMETTPYPTSEHTPESTPIPDYTTIADSEAIEAALSATTGSFETASKNQVYASWAQASTFLNSKHIGEKGVTVRYPDSAIDGDTTTSWQEAASGYGINQWLEIHFNELTEIRYLTFYLGNWESKAVYNQNGRPNELQIEFSDGSSVTCQFDDEMRSQEIMLSRSVLTDWVKITILGAYAGTKFEDTCVSEINFFNDAMDQSAHTPNVQSSHQSSNSGASITQTALSNAYQELVDKCLLFDSSLELPLEAEMLDQTVIRYVEGSFPESNSGGMYLCKSPGEERIGLLKPHTPVTVHAVRGSLSRSTGYAFVETGTGQFGWVAFQSTRGTGIGLAETNDF